MRWDSAPTKMRPVLSRNSWLGRASRETATDTGNSTRVLSSKRKLSTACQVSTVKLLSMILTVTDAAPPGCNFAVEIGGLTETNDLDDSMLHPTGVGPSLIIVTV